MNSVTTNLLIYAIKSITWICNPLCNRPMSHHTSTKPQATDRIFKLTLIYQIWLNLPNSMSSMKYVSTFSTSTGRVSKWPKTYRGTQCFCSTHSAIFRMVLFCYSSLNQIWTAKLRTLFTFLEMHIHNAKQTEIGKHIAQTVAHIIHVYIAIYLCCERIKIYTTLNNMKTCHRLFHFEEYDYSLC